MPPSHFTELVFLCMQTIQLHRRDTGLFPEQQLNLSYNQNAYIPFIREEFSIQGFEKGTDIRSEQFTQEQRNTLHDALVRQYSGVPNAERSLESIEQLTKPNTFTVTTGHQLSAFTGPAYFVYKILHVVRQTEELNRQFPEQQFIPVYWMASEDHDFEEIRSFQLFNKKYTWETDQQGPVGRFTMEGWDTLKAELHELFVNHPTAEIHALIDSLQGASYAEAFRCFVHHLFGKYGVVIVDGDDPALKRLFLPVIEKELRTGFSFKAVEKTTGELERHGVKIQVTPREINLFYIENGLRERIIANGDRFDIAGKGSYSLDALLQLANDHPELFSPNVVLRPLYQEIILPNVCYVGGAGEISYWLQLKRVFDAVDVPYPLIQVRNSVLWIDGGTHEKMEKLSLRIEQIFQPVDLLKKGYVEANSEEELDFSQLNKIVEALQKLMSEQAAQVDPQLANYAAAEGTRLEKQISGFQDKLYRASKGRHEKALKAIDHIADRLFPNGGLQERSMNFFQLTPDGNYSEKLDALKNNLDVFGNDLIVVLG